jgi:hypothetical protein
MRPLAGASRKGVLASLSAPFSSASFRSVPNSVRRDDNDAASEPLNMSVCVVVRRHQGRVGGAHFDRGVHRDQLPPDGLVDVVDVPRMELAEGNAVQYAIESFHETDSHERR